MFRLYHCSCNSGNLNSCHLLMFTVLCVMSSFSILCRLQYFVGDLIVSHFSLESHLDVVMLLSSSISALLILCCQQTLFSTFDIEYLLHWYIMHVSNHFMILCGILTHLACYSYGHKCIVCLLCYFVVCFIVLTCGNMFRWMILRFCVYFHNSFVAVLL